MHWIAPSEKDAHNAALEERLWDAAEQAVPAPHFAKGDFNGGHSQGILGLIFLRFAEVRFAVQRARVLKQAQTARPSRRSLGEGGRVDEPAAYHAEGILYMPAEARFEYLLIFNILTPPAPELSSEEHAEVKKEAESLARLQSWMERKRLAAVSGPVYGHFDRPWMPAFLRRNEVTLKTGDPRPQ